MDRSCFYLLVALCLIGNVFSFDEFEHEIIEDQINVFWKFHQCMINVVNESEDWKESKCDKMDDCLDSLFEVSEQFLSPGMDNFVKSDIQRSLWQVEMDCGGWFREDNSSLLCQMQEIGNCFDNLTGETCEKLKLLSYCFGPYSMNCSDRTLASIMRRIALGMWETLHCNVVKSNVPQQRSDSLMNPNKFVEEIYTTKYYPTAYDKKSYKDDANYRVLEVQFENGRINSSKDMEEEEGIVLSVTREANFETIVNVMGKNRDSDKDHEMVDEHVDDVIDVVATNRLMDDSKNSTGVFRSMDDAENSTGVFRTLEHGNNYTDVIARFLDHDENVTGVAGHSMTEEKKSQINRSKESLVKVGKFNTSDDTVALILFMTDGNSSNSEHVEAANFTGRNPLFFNGTFGREFNHDNNETKGRSGFFDNSMNATQTTVEFPKFVFSFKKTQGRIINRENQQLNTTTATTELQQTFGGRHLETTIIDTATSTESTPVAAGLSLVLSHALIFMALVLNGIILMTLL